ncbi:DNA glycosylase [Suillus fuscotomentosus]|uniref:DNA glycosylase n=1 Tax=Suillus fuscotomentosus TaxID=1912939 RepID=A0AAD4DZY5_9AGAM|nr:DNA glycosylase [Suillus fuscotomentosus]KAG1896656.1 DNA glycosylase [Suillus fuscotomentosus]
MKFALGFYTRSRLRFIMPVTRSATRSVASTPAGGSNKTTTAVSPSAVGKSSKRKAAEEPPAAKKTPRTKKTKSSEADKSAVTLLTPDGFIPPPPPPLQNESEETNLVPAVLTFSFEEAKAHLIRADHRFEDIFTKLKCKPFEFLEQVHPFRALVESILAQQISWLAARSITHRFTRLYDPSLPEKVADYSASKSPTSFFPTPYQVANTDILTLKSAGLSTRKAEYVQDLAARFADERLSTKKLLAADDETLAAMLIEVRGIGRWTVDMFAIFSLRRPNILPVGDLGIQRGMLRWFLSRHSSKHTFTLSPHKLSSSKLDDDKTKPASTSAMGPPPATPAPKTTPSSQLTGNVELDNEVLPTSPESQLQAPASIESTSAFPEPFTPSIEKTLEADAMNTEPLPEGLSVANLKLRLEGKKIKGAFLTPKEMEDLTASWVPYRSLGVYYMWALSEEKK